MHFPFVIFPTGSRKRRKYLINYAPSHIHIFVSVQKDRCNTLHTLYCCHLLRRNCRYLIKKIFRSNRVWTKINLRFAMNCKCTAVIAFTFALQKFRPSTIPVSLFLSFPGSASISLCVRESESTERILFFIFLSSLVTTTVETWS